MLHLENKWMTNTLAKKSMLNNDFIECESGARLYIVGYGTLTSSGKNTYNYNVKDAQGVTLASGENAYLDKLTTLVKGSSPKAKANKESNNSNNDESMKAKKSTLVHEFIKLRDNLKKATLAFNDFQTLHKVTTFEDVVKLENEIEKRNETLNALYKTLEVAKASANEDLIKSIEAMIKEKESE